MSVTCVSLPVEELARTAVRLLAAQANGETAASVTILAPTLKVGDTTGPAPVQIRDQP